MVGGHPVPRAGAPLEFDGARIRAALAKGSANIEVALAVATETTFCLRSSRQAYVAENAAQYLS